MHNIGLTPFKTILIFFVLSIIGLSLIPKLPIELNPDYNLPNLTIGYSLPHSPPEIVEQLATSPLENAFSQINNMQLIKSVSDYNQGSITMAFDKNADLDFKKFEITSIIRRIYPKLPRNLSYPILSQSGEDHQSNSPVLVYSINAPFASHQIKSVTDELLKKPLSLIGGVKEVRVEGAEGLRITLLFDEDKLQLYNCRFNKIAEMIATNFNITFPGIFNNSAGQKLFIKTGGVLQSLEQIKGQVIKMENNSLVRVGDVAKVYLEEQPPHSYSRINGLNAITISIYARLGENKIKLSKAIRKLVAESAGNLPKSFTLTENYNEVKYLEDELHKIYKRSGLSILILIALIFLSNGNVRYLFILCSGILVNLCLTIILLNALRINIHLYSLAGITISFGLILDNAIIMLEHLYKKHDRRVFLALLAASLTTVAAIMIVFFLPEQQRQNLTEFSLVIIINLGVSLLVALFFTPAMYRLFLKNEKIKSPHAFNRNNRLHVKVFNYYFSFVRFLATYRQSFILFMVLTFGLPVFLMPQQWKNHSWYNDTIGSEFYREKIRPVTDRVFGGTFRMFVRNVYEKSGYRNPEKTKLYITASLPYGHKLNQMNNIISRMERYLKHYGGIDQCISNVNSGQYASIIIIFKKAFENGGYPHKLKRGLVNKSVNWSGVNWDIQGVGEGFSTRPGWEFPAFSVEMRGYNYGELTRQANVLAERLLRHKRIRKVNTNERLSNRQKASKELVMYLDKEKIALSNTSYAEIAGKLKNISEPRAPNFYLHYKGELLPMVLAGSRSTDFSKFTLINETLMLDSVRAVHLGDMGTLKFEKSANAILRENRQYIRVVSFNYHGSSKFGNQYLENTLEELRNEMPVGYEAKKRSVNGQFDEKKQQYTLLAVLLVLVFFICAILFENLKQPFYIITTIPISFIGLFLTFSLFGFHFDQGGYAAFVMLGGLVVNAGIFVVNDFNNLKEGYYNRNVIKASVGKVRPILLTVLSTCFGLIPFMIEGPDEIFWFSLAIGTTGGLLCSLFAVFVCLPVFLFKRAKSQTAQKMSGPKTLKYNRWGI